MKREEAIDLMNVIVHMLKPQYDTDRIEEAVEMAIKALEQEPCEDAISRESLMKKCIYTPIAPVINGDEVHYEDVVFAKDIINAEPLYPELKTGHWISGHKETGALGIIYTEKICSNCGWNHSLVIPKNYCPNCGAKMEVEE